MFNDLRRWWALRKMSNRDLKQLNELIIKSARRCAYDLSHAASTISTLGPGDIPEEYHVFRERADYWKSVFNPADGGKNYRSSLGNEIMELEAEVTRLQRLCKENNINYENPNRIPF